MRSIVYAYVVQCVLRKTAQTAGKAPARGAVEQTVTPGAAQEATDCGKVSHELLIFRSAANSVEKRSS